MQETTKPILQEFIKGICFICGEKLTKKDYYAHYECCIAYSEEKEKKIKNVI